MTRHKKIIEQTGNFDEILQKELQNPKQARLYLDIALAEYEEDKDIEAFLLALRTLADARGGLSMLAEKTNLSRQNLYRALSSSGNPRLDTLTSILHGLGYRLSVQPLGVR